jgi:cyanate permease
VEQSSPLSGICESGIYQRDRHRKPGHMLRTLRRIARIGVLVGVLLSALLTTWLFIANRVPALDQFAAFRNAVAAGALIAVALIPILRFRRHPIEVIPCAAIGLGVASLCYFAWTVYFERLANRMSAGRIFVMGMAVYIFAAAALWLVGLVRDARHHHHLTMQPAARRRS